MSVSDERLAELRRYFASTPGQPERTLKDTIAAIDELVERRRDTEDYVRVPREPTPEMMKHINWRIGFASCRMGYQDMLRFGLAASETTPET